MEENKKRGNKLLKIIFMVFICVAVVMLMPRISQFSYNYQKGMVWQYETLKAPFDFPIHKSAEDMQAEISRIQEEQLPIFIYEPTPGEIQVNRLAERLNPLRNETNEEYLNGLITRLNRLYQEGIVQIPDEVLNYSIFLLVKDNVASDVSVASLHTLKEAYEEMMKVVEKIPNESKSKTANPLSGEEFKQIVSEIQDLNLTNFLQPNVVYDAARTKMAVEDAVKRINPTQGMIRKGETLIVENEPITAEKYKLLESYRQEYTQNLGSQKDQLEGYIAQTLLTLLSVILFVICIFFLEKDLLLRNKDFYFLGSMFLVTVAIGSLSFYNSIDIMLLPILFTVLVVNILFGFKPALFLLITTSLLISFFAPNSYLYLFMQLSAGIIGIRSMHHFQRRSQFFLSIFLIFITYAVVFTAFTLLNEGEVTMHHLRVYVTLFFNVVMLTLVYPLLYIFERIFGYTSDISLMEFSNPNHPVLRQLSKVAPGTFQHSLMVANLAEDAIYEIGGSPLLARTGALYHDIGKCKRPEMFIENQSGGVSPHALYDFDESARIIIEHVEKGVELAHDHKLPSVVIAFIQTHHGRGKTKYFYNSYCNKYPDKKVDEALFTYPGPDPSTRECAVVMMADAVEAASRSLTEKSEENLETLVNNIIDEQVRDGRFNHADISLREISRVKVVFVHMLATAYHSRMSYPKLTKEAKNE